MIASHWNGEGFVLALSSPGRVEETDESSTTITTDDSVTVVESVVVGLVPTTDGSVTATDSPALQVTTTTNGSGVLLGHTVLPDGSWWDETYDTASALLRRTLVTPEGSTSTEVIRHGRVEVGDDYVSVGDEVVLRRDAEGIWHGSVDRPTRDALASLVERFGGTGLIPVLGS